MQAYNCMHRGSWGCQHSFGLRDDVRAQDGELRDAAAAAEAASAGAGGLLEPALMSMLHAGLHGQMAPGGAQGALAGAELLGNAVGPACSSPVDHKSTG